MSKKEDEKSNYKFSANSSVAGERTNNIFLGHFSQSKQKRVYETESACIFIQDTIDDVRERDATASRCDCVIQPRNFSNVEENGYDCGLRKSSHSKFSSHNDTNHYPLSLVWRQCRSFNPFYFLYNLLVVALRLNNFFFSLLDFHIRVFSFSSFLPFDAQGTTQKSF